MVHVGRSTGLNRSPDDANVKGQGVPRDYVRAHLLYSLAVLHGAKLVAKGRDTIAEHMTLAQVAEAQRLAREWMANFQARGGEEVGGSRH